MLCDGKFVIYMPHYPKSSPIIRARFCLHVSKDKASDLVVICVSIPHPEVPDQFHTGALCYITRGQYHVPKRDQNG